jgi:hypothetical protein
VSFAAATHGDIGRRRIAPGAWGALARFVARPRAPRERASQVFDGVRSPAAAAGKSTLFQIIPRSSLASGAVEICGEFFPPFDSLHAPIDEAPGPSHGENVR